MGTNNGNVPDDISIRHQYGEVESCKSIYQLNRFMIDSLMARALFYRKSPRDYFEIVSILSQYSYTIVSIHKGFWQAIICFQNKIIRLEDYYSKTNNCINERL
jgi:hypothetical protein